MTSVKYHCFNSVKNVPSSLLPIPAPSSLKLFAAGAPSPSLCSPELLCDICKMQKPAML